MCSNFYFATAKRFYLFQKFWNKTKTFWCVPTFFLAKAKRYYLIQNLINRTKTFGFSSQISKIKKRTFCSLKKNLETEQTNCFWTKNFEIWKRMFCSDNEFCFKNENIRFFWGTFVGKRKQTILKKRWFDITTC